MNDWHQTLGAVLNSDAPLSRAGMIGAAVCLVWGAAVIAWCALKLRRRWAGRRRFVRQALERGFDHEEATHLWCIARSSPEGDDREAILASCEAFDRCLRAAEEAADGDPVLRPDYLAGSVTSALRRKYADTRRARRRIGDTHEIEANQPVRVRLGASRTTFESFVLNVAPDSLQLSLPADATLPPAMELADCPAFMSFWRPHDARYECTARVTRGETAPRDRCLVLSHASLNRVQEREHVRVRCRQEIRLGVFDPAAAGRDAGREGEPELPFVAMLHDLSNGGASLVTDKPIATGARVYLRIPLLRKPWSLTLAARALRQSLLGGTSNASWQCSVRFEPLAARAENQLSRFIADLQQRLIARMLARAGSEEEPETQAWRSPVREPAVQAERSGQADEAPEPEPARELETAKWEL
jgi:c-di-GMP-binding flagellar brake protein YcgR